MGQAALKYDDFDELDQVPIPEGGIATFLTAETTVLTVETIVLIAKTIVLTAETTVLAAEAIV